MEFIYGCKNFNFENDMCRDCVLTAEINQDMAEFVAMEYGNIDSGLPFDGDSIPFDKLTEEDYVNLHISRFDNNDLMG